MKTNCESDGSSASSWSLIVATAGLLSNHESDERSGGGEVAVSSGETAAMSTSTSTTSGWDPSTAATETCRSDIRHGVQ